MAPVNANLKSANPALKFGATIYDDQLTSAYLLDARLPAATRAQFDDVHLFVHFRQDGLNFEQSVQRVKQMFPNALNSAGSYAYDRRAYVPCTPRGTPCTTQQDLELFSQTVTIQAQLLANKSGRLDRALSWLLRRRRQMDWLERSARMCAWRPRELHRQHQDHAPGRAHYPGRPGPGVQDLIGLAGWRGPSDAGPAAEDHALDLGRPQ